MIAPVDAAPEAAADKDCLRYTIRSARFPIPATLSPNTGERARRELATLSMAKELFLYPCVSALLVAEALYFSIASCFWASTCSSLRRYSSNCASAFFNSAVSRANTLSRSMSPVLPIAFSRAEY